MNSGKQVYAQITERPSICAMLPCFLASRNIPRSYFFRASYVHVSALYSIQNTVYCFYDGGGGGVEGAENSPVCRQKTRAAEHWLVAAPNRSTKQRTGIIVMFVSFRKMLSFEHKIRYYLVIFKENILSFCLKHARILYCILVSQSYNADYIIYFAELLYISSLYVHCTSSHFSSMYS